MRPILALAFAGALAGSARADNLRCGERLVNPGDTLADVAAKCGPPAAADHRVDRRRFRGACFTTIIDTWTYDQGPSSFIRILTFTDGTLERIELGDYGTTR